jgi:TetR/AcrR family transcriptional regulator, cholesterol catabolism regulator
VASGRDPVAGGKRAAILDTAIERFGGDGYEHTKWADVAADVGVGPTALYHYFESKQHCLFVVMDQALVELDHRFQDLTQGNPDHVAALRAVLADCFDVSEHEALRNRVLVAEQGLLAHPCGSPREEEARQTARMHTRDIERAWTLFLAAAADSGAIAIANPRLTARAILGIYNSIWLWFRPRGRIELDRVAGFFTDRILAIVGLEPEPSDRLQEAA